MFEEILLKDRTTGKNILWANAEHGDKEITLEDIPTIKPRHEKNSQDKKQRAKDRAEIFTPPEVCKIQNDLIDFDKKDWKGYVMKKILEITCGEAPYLVNRYNAVTGEVVPLAERIGILDRKLRVVSAETSAVADWLDWAIHAVQSVYGYEFQGDNLFLARLNVFETVKDFYPKNFSKPPEDFLSQVAEIISWNLWQMDGLKKLEPLFGKKIMDWKENKIIIFDSLL